MTDLISLIKYLEKLVNIDEYHKIMLVCKNELDKRISELNEIELPPNCKRWKEYDVKRK